MVSHSNHGLVRDGGSWYRAYGAEPGGFGHTAGYVTVLPVCKVGTLLAHSGMDAVLNLCATE